MLLVKTSGFTSFVIIALGAVLAVRGIVSIIAYFRAKPEEAAKGQELASGFILLAVGLFCVLRSEWFIVTFPVLTLIYGVIIFFAGITKIQWVVDCIRLKKGQWVFALISALLSLISAVIIIKNPFTTTVILWSFTAISLIVEAVFDVAAFFSEAGNGRGDAKKGKYK